MAVSIQPEFLDHRSASPGVCVACHASKRKSESGVMDLGVRIELERGYLQVCQACCEEAAGGFGMLNPEASDLLRSENDFLRKELESVQAELADAQAALDALVSFKQRRQTRVAKDAE